MASSPTNTGAYPAERLTALKMTRDAPIATLQRTATLVCPTLHIEKV